MVDHAGLETAGWTAVVVDPGTGLAEGAGWPADDALVGSASLAEWVEAAVARQRRSFCGNRTGIKGQLLSKNWWSGPC